MELKANAVNVNPIEEEGLFVGRITHAVIADGNHQWAPGMELKEKAKLPEYAPCPQVMVRLQSDKGSSIGTFNLLGFARWEDLSEKERKSFKEVSDGRGNNYAMDDKGYRKVSESATEQALGIFSRLVAACGLEKIDLGSKDETDMVDIADKHFGEPVSDIVGKTVAFRTTAYENANGDIRHQINTGRIYDAEYGKKLLAAEVEDSF